MDDLIRVYQSPDSTKFGDKLFIKVEPNQEVKLPEFIQKAGYVEVAKLDTKAIMSLTQQITSEGVFKKSYN